MHKYIFNQYKLSLYSTTIMQISYISIFKICRAEVIHSVSFCFPSHNRIHVHVGIFNIYTVGHITCSLSVQNIECLWQYFLAAETKNAMRLHANVMSSML